MNPETVKSRKLRGTVVYRGSGLDDVCTVVPISSADPGPRRRGRVAPKARPGVEEVRSKAFVASAAGAVSAT